MLIRKIKQDVFNYIIIVHMCIDAYNAYLKSENEKRRQTFVAEKINEFLEKMNAAESQYLGHSRYYIE